MDRWNGRDEYGALARGGGSAGIGGGDNAANVSKALYYTPDVSYLWKPTLVGKKGGPQCRGVQKSKTLKRTLQPAVITYQTPGSLLTLHKPRRDSRGNQLLGIYPKNQN